MMLKQRLSILALVVAGGFSMTACTDDELPEVPTEPVVAVPSQLEVPAPPPPSEPAVPQDLATKTVYFAFDDYTLGAEAQESLNKLAEYMKAAGSTVVQIEGHCDERGSVEYNLALGERRAQSVKNYLMQLGVDPARLPTISYGEEVPAVKGSNESAWAKNRRAKFVVTAP